jgi:hypothetical protein
MGCDIHLFTEVKIDGVWHTYSHPHIQRNYALFEKMAGMRGNVANAISAPKGLPDDLSVVARYSANRWGNDGHSHSWFDAKEVAEIVAWYAGSGWTRDWEVDHLGFLEGNGWDAPHKFGEYPPGIQAIRWVFWFDS